MSLMPEVQGHLREQEEALNEIFLFICINMFPSTVFKCDRCACCIFFFVVFREW